MNENEAIPELPEPEVEQQTLPEPAVEPSATPRATEQAPEPVAPVARQRERLWTEDTIRPQSEQAPDDLRAVLASIERRLESIEQTLGTKLGWQQ